MSRLLYRDAQGRDGGVELRDQPIYIGRAVDCAIRTDDAMVSRKHSMVGFQDGRYFIEDLESSNGTHVNDIRVKRQALAHNDVVRCGSLWLRFVEDAPKALPTSAFRAAGQPPPLPGPAHSAAELSGAPFGGQQPGGAGLAHAGTSPPQLGGAAFGQQAGAPVFSPAPTGAPRAPAEIGTLHHGGAGGASEDPAALRRQIAELQAARDQAVTQARWLRDEVTKKFKAMATDLERMRGELEELMRKIGG
jgi:hypothetical protein